MYVKATTHLFVIFSLLKYRGHSDDPYDESSHCAFISIANMPKEAEIIIKII